MTYADLIDRVLANCGEADVIDTADRGRILDHMKDILRNDIPNRSGGPWTEGFVTLTLAAGTGAYAVPAALRSFQGPLVWNSDKVWDGERHGRVADYGYANRGDSQIFFWLKC